MENAISYLNVLPSTKTEVEKFVQKIIDEVEDPLALAVQLKAMEEVVKKLRASPKIKDWVREELEKHNGATKYLGNDISRIETGVSYDYQGDKALAALEVKQNILKAKIKSRQDVLKAGGGHLPAIKSSTSSYKISLH